jgi:hypothetical protein
MFNKRSVFFPFLALLVFVISVGCLCTGLTNKVTETATPVPSPTQAPVQQPTKVPATEVPATEAPISNNNNNNSGGWTTFTDENGFYAIDVPSDWVYEHNVTDDNFVYIDTFTSPDGAAVVENIVYDDGKPFTGNDKANAALFFLNKWYSNTGREGDIRVSEDKIMPDGSERLTWTSKSGGYSGVSFLETRGKTTFLFFTVNWGNDYYEQYSETVDAILGSYTIP